MFVLETTRKMHNVLPVTDLFPPSPFRQTYPIVLALYAGITALGASPVIPGFHAKHPLDEAQQGAVLITELRCAACHEGSSPSAPLSAPDLSEVGSRLNPDFIRKFIENPHSNDPATAMPDLLGGLPEPERKEIAASVTAYLLSLGKSEPTPDPGPAPQDGSGSELYHEAGCVACHSPLEKAGAEPLKGAVGLGHVGAKYRPGGLADFLQDPLKVRPDGRMPDMKLSRQEAELLAAFLIGNEAQKPAAPEGGEDRIAAGKKAFTELRCDSCHAVEGNKPALASSKPFAAMDLNAGCLSEKPGSAPDYQLSAIQRTAIRKALATKPSAPKTADAVKMRLTALNCISCHQRDDYGGVSPDLDSYFHSTEEALGNESRIPPTLTDVGWKLRPDWMNKVLYEAERVRPYMKTRMPQYGTEALDGLPGQLHDVDQREPFDFPPIPQAEDRNVRDAATELLGDKGLNCIACHNYNGKESPGMKGLDIMTSYQRLQPGWYNEFMLNPAKFRPGIIMPSFWPDGKALRADILGGDTEAQIAALWHNFSLGRSARDPSGLRVEEPEITVGDTAVTYRGRSQVAGYRGIAVGFPGGLNYAFNAQTGALSAIWTGKFVRVGWNGQGSGNFTPLEKAIQLPQDVAFLTEPKDPWPLAPIRSKENPVNPDPLYPRQHGYAFKGYSIGENGIPTFRYKSGEVSIEDASHTLSIDSKTVLRRNLTFTTKKATSIHFRALTGNIETRAGNIFKNEDISLTFLQSKEGASIAESKSSAGEAIVTIALPAGTSKLTLDYAPLR
ncbi:c-type cytochrome [Akkermansiaceae bacterium]|nr:c-type cytochrome [Akkermansiaceae bacterium]